MVNILSKVPLPRPRYGILLFFITIITLFCSLDGYTSQNQERFDLIRIRLSIPPEGYQMPDVFFPHDRHTEAIENTSCESCHLKKENIFVFKLKRLKDDGFKNDKKLYHHECIGCHEDRRDQRLKSGPLTGECRMCHSQNPPYIDASQPFGMDKSLHYRHVLSDPIRSVGNEKEENCSACHHEYDKELNKTVYTKGKEGTCRYCHKQEKTEEARSFKTVAHEDCLNCHIALNLQNKKAGPTNCAACHALAKQSKIAKLKEIPRIKRNQPDVVLLSTWLKDSLETGTPSNQFVEPVAFDHLSHEKQVENCRSCHHESMEPCFACHTRTGIEKGKFVILEQAMHSSDTFKSCAGCHIKSMQSPDCAGCHAQLNSRQIGEIRCKRCHSVARESIKPLPIKGDHTIKIAAAEIDMRSAPKPLISDEKIPEKVTIDNMVDQYDSVLFPHRQIVQALAKRTQKSMLAQYFHGETTTLCLGCHHHSASPMTFPKCASCHAMSLKSEKDAKLGLKGAYHIQCMTCHQMMGIKKPVSTACTSCHKKKTTTIQLTNRF
jgi:Class III cytochrome C family/Cytochrome c7 and related cytochrome c